MSSDTSMSGQARLLDQRNLSGRLDTFAELDLATIVLSTELVLFQSLASKALDLADELS